VSFNVFFKLIKVHLLVSDLYMLDCVLIFLSPTVQIILRNIFNINIMKTQIWVDKI